MSFNVGENVGPYRIVQRLGQGGMATVYKAFHAALDRYVALKVLHPAFGEDPNFEARFRREARLVAKLEHPHIVPVYDYAEHKGRSYLVMKFLEGETLKARLGRGPLSTAEITSIVESVGSALAYAHQQGILHRDIKPSNVLLGTNGHVWLADFGLARIAESGESTLSSDMIMGTPQYISPEQAMGTQKLDEGTDIYSFGVMLYEMVVGQVPFNADTPFSIIHDHIYAPLPMPSAINPKVPEAVERVLLKALAKERADRYPDVNSLVQAFKDAWGEAGVPMRGTTIKLRPTALEAAGGTEPSATLATGPVPAQVEAEAAPSAASAPETVIGQAAPAAGPVSAQVEAEAAPSAASVPETVIGQAAPAAGPVPAQVEAEAAPSAASAPETVIGQAAPAAGPVPAQVEPEAAREEVRQPWPFAKTRFPIQEMVLALVGLGVVAVAAIIIGNARRTPAAVAPSASPRAMATSAPLRPVQTPASPTPALPYTIDFEKGQPVSWTLDQGWKVIAEGNNHVLAGSGHFWAHSNLSYQSDYRLVFRLKLLRGTIHLVDHFNKVGRYFIGFTADDASLNKQIWPSNFRSDLAHSTIKHKLNVWYPIEIVSKGNTLTFYVDGRQELTYTDPQPLSYGYFAFETLENSSAYIDDILVDLASPIPGSAGQGDPFIDRVVSFTRGQSANPDFGKVEAVLGPPDYNRPTLTGFLDLGVGGRIILEFVNNLAVDGPGDDIEIFGDPADDEQWIVEASADCVSYKSFGRVGERVSLDLGTIDLASARCIRITDQGTNPHGGISPGAELDAIQALNSSAP